MECIVCDEPLDQFNEFHPSGGLHFFTYGHYGSNVFDPMDGSTLNIFVCDNCLTRKKDKTKHQEN